MSDTEYEYVFSRTPRPCVDLIIEAERGFIVTKRSIEPYKGFWHLPGGRVCYKETVGNAINRIAKNEIGISITGSRLIGFFEILDDGKFVHSISLVFICETNSELPAVTPNNLIKVVNDIPKHMIPKQKSFLLSEWQNIVKLF